MLNALFEKINTLFGKAFLVGSFFPVLVLLAMNGTLLYVTNDDVRALIAAQDSATVSSLSSRALLVVLVLVVFTYAFSSAQVLLRAILEGEYWPWPFGAWGRARHALRRDQLNAEISDARGAFHLLDAEVKVWRIELRQARAEGDRIAASKFKEWPRWQWDTKKVRKPGPALRRLRKARLMGLPIDRDDLERTKIALVEQLKANPSSGSAANFDLAARRALDRLNAEVAHDNDGLLTYAVRRLDLKIARLTAQRSREYGRADVAPTIVGNIARTAGSYSYDRYRLDVDLLWSRLQTVLQKDSLFYATLQDAKTQLDFAVSTYWIVLVSSVFWLVHLATSTYSTPLFLSLAGIAPLVVFGLYVVTISSYHAFADSIRTAVDLYRRQLANALHLKLPSTIEGERAVWDDVGQFIAYGEPLHEELVARETP